MGNDESWEEQRALINSTLNRFEKTLLVLDKRSNSVITEIAIIKTKVSIYSLLIAFGVSTVISLAIKFI